MKNETVSTRRRFFWKAGAVLSVPLAAGAAVASVTEDSASLITRLSELEDVNQIRTLQQRLAQHVNVGASDLAAELFVDPADADALAGLSHLAPADFGEQDIVELSAGGNIASAETHCAVETELALDASGTLAEMARLQGDGVIRRSETRILEAEFVKLQGAWKIRSLGFRGA